MKKKLLIVLFATITVLQLTACSSVVTCKATGCNETELYQGGYCKYHYYKDAGENILKDIFN